MTADFIASPTNTYPNYVIAFTDLSTGGPTTWYWDFGDGTNSAEQNPTKRYGHSGIYTVSLTADGSTETKDDYITINLVGIRQKTNYIYVAGRLKTWDYGPPPSRIPLRIMLETGSGNLSTVSTGGARVIISTQDTSPVSTGFVRGRGPSILFD
jgi:PKD repeat protein